MDGWRKKADLSAQRLVGPDLHVLHECAGSRWRCVHLIPEATTCQPNNSRDGDLICVDAVQGDEAVSATPFTGCSTALISIFAICSAMPSPCFLKPSCSYFWAVSMSMDV